MSKRKKKNALILVCLLVALAALIGFYVWYSGKGPENSENDGISADNEEKKEDSTLTLATLDTALLKSLSITNENADMKLVLQGEEWKSEVNPNRPINQDKVKNMVNIIDEVTAKRVINENPEDLDEYGLKEPTVALVAEQTDGKTLKLTIGDKAIGAEGYYALVDDRKAVYLLESNFGTGLNYSDTDMTAVEAGPTITAENIHHIEVLKKDDGNNFELLYDTENTVDDTGKGMFPWVILKPYEEGYAADSSKVSELLPNFAAFNFINCVDYSGEDLTKYGLDDSATSVFVEYYETYTEPLDKPEKDPKTGEEIKEKTYKVDKNFKLYVGNEDGTGNYFVRREGSNFVYTMRADEVDKMLNVDAFGIISSFINLPNIESVNKIDITIDGKPYTMKIERETVKKEDGEDEIKATYYYNGKVVEEDVFKDVYQVMISAAYDAKITGEVNAEGINPYITITYHVGGDRPATLTTSYLPYDDSFYLIDHGDPIRFFADKREIDEIAKAVIEFVRLEEE